MKAFLTVFLKELIMFFRSWGLVAVVLYSFTVDVYIAGKGFEVKPRNVSVGYVDFTDGVISGKILSHLHSPEFQEPVRFLSEEELKKVLFNRNIMVGIVFDSDFEKDFFEKKAKLNVMLDATAAAQGYVTLAYLQNIVLRFGEENFPVELKTHKLFNQNSDTPKFLSLAEFLSILTLITVILSSVVFVKERESGTWDIMLLMPVNSKIIILAKSFSQIVVVMIGTIICVGIVLFGIFKLPMNGSFMAFLVLTLIYSFSISGIGLFIASVAKNMLQVAQLSVIIMMPIIFLSGSWTPIYSMHPVLQELSLLSPLRYYIEGCESLFFRGTSVFDLWIDFVALLVLGVALYMFGFRKIGKLF